MTTRAVAITNAPIGTEGRQDLSTKIATWSGLVNGDDGVPYGSPHRADRSIEVSGVFGAGGNLRLEGRNDLGGDWSLLTDSRGEPLDIQVAGIYQVTEITLEVRPRVTSGDGTTLLKAVLVARRNQL